MSSEHETDRPLEDLQQQDRVLKAARRLPDGRLSQEDIAGVRGDYRRYTDGRGIYDSTVAGQVGLSKSVVAQFRNGTYKGDVDRVARVLNRWIEQDARKREAQLPAEYVQTRIVEEMKTIVSVACSTSSMAAIVAPSGSGKSMALRVLSEKHLGHYLYCDEDLSPARFLHKLAHAIGAGSGSNKAEASESIVRKMRGTHRPIFLDEAHRLPAAVLPRIRSIHDKAGVPIIMAGAAEILDRIDDRSDGRGQFASRCIQYNVMEHVLNAENPDGGGAAGRPLYTKQEVRAFLDQLQVRLDDGGFELAWAAACLPDFGCLRLLQRVVLLARPDQSRRDEPITRGEVKRSLALLFGEQGHRITRAAERHIERSRKAA